MVLSSFFEDEDVVCQLRSFFDLELQWELDFESFLANVEDYDEVYYSLDIMDKSFVIHKITGEVMEVE